MICHLIPRLMVTQCQKMTTDNLFINRFNFINESLTPWLWWHWLKKSGSDSPRSAGKNAVKRSELLIFNLNIFILF